MRNAIVNKVIAKVGPKMGRLALKVKAKSPELMIAGGIILGGACLFMACKGTLKVEKVLDEHNESIEKIDKDLSDKERRREVAMIYMRTIKRLFKLYWSAIVLGAAAMALFISAHNIMSARVASLSAALTASEEAFKAYRARAVEKYGEEVDRQLRYGFKEVEEEIKTVGEDGSESTEMVKKTVPDVGENPRFTFWFNKENCLGAWEPNLTYNLSYIQAVAADRTRVLNQATGFQFVNDVFDAFNHKREPDGQMWGWLKGLGDNEVKINIVATEGDDVLVELVPDGYILDKI